MSKLTKKMGGRIIALLAAALSLSFAASAATTITINSVAQRWPWNNKVDITYTVGGDGQNVAGGSFKKIMFTSVIGGTTYTITGNTVRASAETGRYTVTWTLPAGVKDAASTISAAVYASDVPTGDDYMIIDLTSGVITWEGMIGTGAAGQAASNARYNTDAYKETKLVLRKVPKWSEASSMPNYASTLSSFDGYPTGHPDQIGAANGRANSPNKWVTTKDYYIGVFPVTQSQYELLYGSNPSGRKDHSASSGMLSYNDIVAHRPVETVSWNDLRGEGTAPNATLPTVDAPNTGTFLQRLNYITGNEFKFDLPTEAMYEIALRAGSTNVYYWGDSPNTDYMVCSDNSGGRTVAVGSRLPNNWGLFEMTGNTYDWCLDTYYTGDLGSWSDAFVPTTLQAASGRRACGGADYTQPSSYALFKASCRGAGYPSPASRSNTWGFRVALIAD